MSDGFTRGPWKVFTVQDGPNKGQLLGVGQDTGEGVTDAYGGLWGSGPEQMANARLISAAPDLLEALIEAKKALWIGARDQWNLSDFNNWAVVQKINVALEKADGQPRASQSGAA